LSEAIDMSTFEPRDDTLIVRILDYKVSDFIHVPETARDNLQGVKAEILAMGPEVNRRFVPGIGQYRDRLSQYQVGDIVMVFQFRISKAPPMLPENVGQIPRDRIWGRVSKRNPNSLN